MTSTVLTALETLLPAATTLLYAALIGFGVQAAVAGYVRFPRSLGITAGIGLSLTALLMVYSYRLFENPTLPIVPLAALAVIVLAIRLYVERSKRKSGNSSLHEQRTGKKLRIAAGPNWQDCIAALVAVLIAYPVLQYGLTTWTTGINDFPNYAASVDIWMTSAETFSRKHPDAFGALQIERAGHEKPMITAILILISKLSSYRAYQLLTPLFIVCAFIATSSLLLIIGRALKIGRFPAILAIVLPTFSVVPISRIYDAQPGQAAVVALLACLLAVLTTPAYPNQRSSNLVVAIIAAIVASAALGSNLTLVAGSSIMLLGLFLWSLSKRWINFLKLFRSSVVGFFITIFLSIPMIDMYYFSFKLQTSADVGFTIPLASPLALFGQQLSLSHVAPESQVLLSWCIAIATGLAVVWTHASKHLRPSFDIFLIAATLANALLIGLNLGWSNYSTHKWLALFIALAGPLLIAYGISLLRKRARTATTLLMVPMAASSIYSAFQYSSKINYIATDDLINLKNNELISEKESINIRLGDMRENSAAALIVPSKSVVVTERTYAAPTLPKDGMSLVRRDRNFADGHSDSIILNNTYALIPSFIIMDERGATFTNNNLISRNYLFGSWHYSEDWATWSGPGNNYVIFDMPDSYHNKDIILTIDGLAYVPRGLSQKLDIFINDEIINSQEYSPGNEKRTFKITIPHLIASKENGRMAINFRVSQPYSPSQFGETDGRTLGFALIRMAVAPAG